MKPNRSLHLTIHGFLPAGSAIMLTPMFLAAVSSMTESKSSRLGAGLEMTLIRRERRRALAICGVAVGERAERIRVTL